VRSASVLPLLLLFVFGAACAKETIAHEQVEVDANLILVLLNREGGIEADKVKDEDSRELRFNVMVQKSQSVQALAVLHKYNLPKTPAADSEAMFREGGMIPTPEQQRAKREVGIRGDIINSLRSVPRIVDVKAVVTLPEDNPLRDVNEAKPKPKASVILLYLEDADGKPPLTVEDVQRYVQASLPELKSVEVSVNMFPADNPAAKGAAGGAGVPMIDPMKGCMEKDIIIGIEVCAGSKRRVINLMFGSAGIAVVLSGFVIFAVLRAMRYRKDLTRLTAQFQNVKAK
jgi:type III secretion system YscJ/HrcJ family lipoprotein